MPRREILVKHLILLLGKRGKNMRSWIYSAVLFAAFSVWAGAGADAVVVNETVPASDLAEISINVTDIGHPVYEPLQLNIHLLCKDHRTNRNSGGPKKTALVKHTKICAWGGHSYSQENKILTIRYATAAIVVGDAPCEMQPPKRFDIKKLCARWNP